MNDCPGGVQILAPTFGASAIDTSYRHQDCSNKFQCH